jgi:hypothetical protein
VTHLTPEDMVPRLVDELGYSPHVAQLVARRLSSAELPRPVRLAFDRWWQTGEIDAGLEAEGFTVSALMERFGLNPVGAFSTMAGLLQEPARTLETLQRGIDRHHGTSLGRKI